MKRSRFTEEQIIGVLREQGAGVSTADVCRPRSGPACVLVRRIADGELSDGLAPSEVHICIEFGVSRAVAREALKILSALDMVDIAQGRRIVVRPPGRVGLHEPVARRMAALATCPRAAQGVARGAPRL